MRAPLARRSHESSGEPLNDHNGIPRHPWPGEDFASRGHAHLWRRRRPHLRLAWLAGLLLGGRPGLQEASPALAACSHEPAMLGAAGAGDEAALLTSLNKLLVACRSPSLCRHAGLSAALVPLVDSMLTQVLAAQVAAALADDLGHEAVGADVGRGGRKKTRLKRQVEVCCESRLARALWKNHSAAE